MSAPALGPCPHRNLWRSACKKRVCPICGVRWARNWFQAMVANLTAYGGPVVLVSLTAPGAEQLPWDLEHCKGRRPHECTGKDGCRVQQRAAREWADTCTWRYAKLRQAARIAAIRAMVELHGVKFAPTLLERVWEPQKRGVPHLHLIVGYRSQLEKDAAHLFVRELKRLACDYGFGFVDARGKKQRNGVKLRGVVVERHGVEVRPIAPELAARYLSSYLTGRNSKKKNTIRENIADPVMPRSLIWLTPKLTRRTFVTMRLLRRARHLWAAAKGVCDAPKWAGMVEVVKVAACFRRVYGRAGPLEDEDEWLRFAERVDVERAFAVRLDWRLEYDYSHLVELTRFAYMLAGVTPKFEPAAA